MTPIRPTMLGMTFLILAWANLIATSNPVLGIICGIGFLWAISRLFGSRFFPTGDSAQQLIIGLLTSSAILMLGGSAIYYFGSVTQLNLGILLVIILAIATLVARKPSSKSKESITKYAVILIATVLICLFAWWSTLWPIEITQSIRSPWLVVDPKILLPLLIAIISAITLITKTVSKISTFLLVLIFASSLTMAVTIYSLGYGFDPFIHRATVEHITQFGTITPKPFYYIGQYALELIGMLIFALPLKLMDSLLVPIGAALLIPWSAYTSIKILGQNWRLLLVSLLLLPLGIFISTTPQSIAYILATCLVILSIPLLLNKIEDKIYLGFLGLLTLAILITHPLAGIPSGFFFVLVFISQISISKTTEIILLLIASILATVSLPIIFVWQSLGSNLNIEFSLTNLAWNQLQLTGFFSNQYNSWLDGLYLVIDNYLWIIIALSIVGIIFAVKEKLPRGVYIGLYAAIASLISYLILTLTLQFEFLIEYERTNYADRLLTMAVIFLIPYVGIALCELWARLTTKPQALQLSFILLLSLMATALVYGAYPRHDNYARSAGFNVSQADVDAIYAIENYAKDTPYIVLANQATSSAALEAFGFAHYYHDDIFYYPIPTGGELYNLYLEMTDNEPTAEVMNEAMDLAGVKLGFFAINNYWWDSERIIEHAKNQSIDWFALGDGAVTVFVFER